MSCSVLPGAGLRPGPSPAPKSDPGPLLGPAAPSGASAPSVGSLSLSFPIMRGGVLGVTPEPARRAAVSSQHRARRSGAGVGLSEPRAGGGGAQGAPSDLTGGASKASRRRERMSSRALERKHRVGPRRHCGWQKVLGLRVISNHHSALGEPGRAVSAPRSLILSLVRPQVPLRCLGTE